MQSEVRAWTSLDSAGRCLYLSQLEGLLKQVPVPHVNQQLWRLTRLLAVSQRSGLESLASEDKGMGVCGQAGWGHRIALVQGPLCAPATLNRPAAKKEPQLKGLENNILVQLLVVSDSLRSHGRQHARLPCSSLSPRVCSNSCPSSQ